MKTSVKIVITLLVLALFAFLAVASGDKSEEAGEKIDKIGESGSNSTKEAAIGSTVKAGDFEVTVHSFNLQNSVDTGNMFIEYKAEEGIKYGVLDIEFKNIGKQSKMITEGALSIKPKDSDPLVMESETVMLDGWGLFLDSVNPLVSKRTKLLYKLPTSVSGTIYFDPQMGSESLFNLGQL